MPSSLIMLLLLLITAVAGLLLLRLFAPLRALRPLDAAFAGVTLGVLLLGWLALLLAELDRFALFNLQALWLGAALLLAGGVWWRGRGKGDGTAVRLPGASPARHGWPLPARWDRWLQAGLLVWFAGVLVLFWRPHEYILGGADAGVYVSLGAEIAGHGGFRIMDEALAALDPAVRSAFLRPLPANPVAPAYLFPGFYVTDPAAGQIVPQFYPLHPVWQAAGYAFAGSPLRGAETALLFSGLWLALASLAIVLLGWELGGWPAALLLAAAVPITALQVWFARYPTTEALTQYLIWSGLWAMWLWLDGRRPASLWAFLAGTAFGSVFLVRIDILILLPLLALFLFGLWYRGWRRADTWFALPLIVLVAHSFLHGLLWSAPYFYEHVGLGLRLLWVNWWIPLFGALAAAALLGAAWAVRRRGRDFARYRRPLLLVAAGAFLAFALYSWFVRPYTGVAVLRPDLYSETELLITNHENFLRLGWYLALPGIWLGVAGICWLIWRVEGKTAVLVALGVTFTIVYLWNVRANPHQVYVMRRYVPAVVPFFLLAAAYLLSRLALLRPRASWPRGAPQTIALLLGLAWLAGLTWSARGFVSQVDYDGLLAQVAALEAELPTEAILLFNDQSPVGQGDFWGTPLRFLFGHEAYTIRDPLILEGDALAQTIEVWQNNGRAVVWFGDPAWLIAQGFTFRERPFTIASQRLESSYERKPQQVIYETWPFRVAILDPAP